LVVVGIATSLVLVAAGSVTRIIVPIVIEKTFQTVVTLTTTRATRIPPGTVSYAFIVDAAYETRGADTVRATF
jgi:hypothetical protein